MDIAEFKNLVASYMNREAAAFQSVDPATGKTTDLLLLAANNAKLFAQRKMLFEMAKCPILYMVDPVGGVNWATGRIYGTNVLVGVRHLIRASILVENYRVPVELVSLATTVRDSMQQNEYCASPVEKFACSSPSRARVAMSGAILYVENYTSTESLIPIVCDSYHWLTPYLDQPTSLPDDWPGRTDFFLNYCTDWMLYRCIQELNLFLKEDQRMPVSVRVLEEAWETVKTWNSNLATTTDEFTFE